MPEVLCHVESNGLSKCCDAHPYRLNDGPWRCGICSKVCARYVPQRQDSLYDQMRDVMKLAVQSGCYDAHEWLLRNFLDRATASTRNQQEG